MRLFFLAVSLLIVTTAFADMTKDNLYGYLQGTYLLIGKHLESTDTYYGEVLISGAESGLTVTRTIDGNVTHGKGMMTDDTHNHLPVLRIQFSEGRKDFEETCLVANDLDNYARITCYFYIPGTRTKNPGMEALFFKVPLS